MQGTRVFLRVVPIFVTLTLAALQTIRASNLDLSRHSVAGGGVMQSTGGEFELSGTIGQWDADTMTGGNLELSGGFWFSLAPGDCNADGGVNLFDYADWIACLSGPDHRVPVGCVCFDLDHDDDVDLVDAAEFQMSFAGS